jgi:AraC-like DNA-binding protein
VIWKETGITLEQQKIRVMKEMQFASMAPISHVQLSDRIDLKKRFLIMYKEFLDQNTNYLLMLKSICLELLVLFLKGQEERKEKEGKVTKCWPIIESTINYINERYWDPELDNASISKHVGISTNHLSYVFKEELGITIHKYLTHIRIEQSKINIIEGKKSLTAIAEEAGFSTIHSFSRSFKATVGIMPSMFAVTQSKATQNYNKKEIQQ